MKRRIRFSPRAWREIERGSAWWRRHREKAPDAFDVDTNAAIDLIRSEPHIGTPIRAKRLGVRALWIERIGYSLYYVEISEEVIEILALWHASRGSSPKL